MTTAAPKLRQRSMPQFGTIRGGTLHGWAYTATGAGVRDGKAYVEVLAHAPGWPFPPLKPTRLTNSDFGRLRYEKPAGNVFRPLPADFDAEKRVLAAVVAQEEAR